MSSPKALAGDEAIILAFPDVGLRRALLVLKDDDASELERTLAASVVLVAIRRGARLPAWAVCAMESIRIGG